jgi:hypothetical protein
MAIALVVLMVMGLALLGMGLRKFDWGLFVVALGGVVVLAAAAPLLGMSRLAEHPLLATALMLVAIVGFVVWVSMWGLKRKRERGV